MSKECSSLGETGDARISQSEVISRLAGDIGRWQILNSLLMSFLKFSVPWVQLGIIFLAFPQQYWCKKPQGVNISEEHWKNLSKSADGQDACVEKRINYNSIHEYETTPCQYFEFDKSIFKSTIISDWNLVCSKAYYVQFSQASLMLGVLIGNFIFGVISDKYGRKKSLLVCLIMQTVGGIASAFTPWFIGFLVSRFMLAMASGGIATVTFVLCLETVGGKWKNIVPILYHIPFGLGNSVLAGVAYILRDWRLIQVVLSMLSFTYLILILFIFESPKWLLATKQHDKAIETLEKICAFNKRDNISSAKRIVAASIENATNPKAVEIKSIFTSKRLRTKSAILWIECFLSGISFFAFVQFVGVVDKNIFLSVSLNGFGVIPGTILTLLLLKYSNYKSTIILAQLWTAFCYLAIVIVPLGYNWTQICLAVLGIVGLSVELPVLSIYIGLLYPTEVRNAGIGIAIMFNRLGSIISPFIIYLEKFSSAAPCILLCLLTLVQAILMCFMPDVKYETFHLCTNTENNNNKESQSQQVALIPVEITETLNKV